MHHLQGVSFISNKLPYLKAQEYLFFNHFPIFSRAAMFGNQTFNFAPSVVLINSNFKTMMSLPLCQSVLIGVSWHSC